MIGVFDSGFGGLTILKEFVNVLPQYDYLYLGDNARVPYGNRSAETVYGFTVDAVNFLFKQNCELIILACNTASALALRKIQQEWLPEHYPGKRVLGVVRPVVERAVLAGDKIGLVGTRGTIDSKAYEIEINKINPQAQVFSQACPLLVPMIEEGFDRQPEIKTILKKYLAPLKQKNIDTLILGCTHYPIIKKMFEKKIGRSVKVLDTGKIVAESLQDYLIRHPEIEIKLSKNGKVNFYTTDSTEKFDQLGSKFFGQKIKSEKVELHS